MGTVHCRSHNMDLMNLHCVFFCTTGKWRGFWTEKTLLHLKIFQKLPLSVNPEQGDSPLGFLENKDCESSSLEEVLEAGRRWEGWCLCQLFQFYVDLTFLHYILQRRIHSWLLQQAPHPCIVQTVWDPIVLKNNELFHLPFTCSVILHGQVSPWRSQATHW